jgi:hypothetical protein
MLNHAPTCIHLPPTHADVQMLAFQYTHGCHVTYSSVKNIFNQPYF